MLAFYRPSTSRDHQLCFLLYFVCRIKKKEIVFVCDVKVCIFFFCFGEQQVDIFDITPVFIQEQGKIYLTHQQSTHTTHEGSKCRSPPGGQFKLFKYKLFFYIFFKGPKKEESNGNTQTLQKTSKITTRK